LLLLRHLARYNDLMGYSQSIIALGILAEQLKSWLKGMEHFSMRKDIVGSASCYQKRRNTLTQAVTYASASSMWQRLLITGFCLWLVCSTLIGEAASSYAATTLAVSPNTNATAIGSNDSSSDSPDDINNSGSNALNSVRPDLGGLVNQAFNATRNTNLISGPAFNTKNIAISAAQKETLKKQAIVAQSKLPLSFEIDQGQTDPQVSFLARGNNYNLFLTPNKVVLDLHKPTTVTTAAKQRSQHTIADSSAVTTQTVREGAVLEMSLVGSNPQVHLQPLQPLEVKSNYLVGSDSAKWIKDVPSYTAIQYQQIYNGIDLTYYGNQDDQLEYDFMVAPNADPNQITLNFEGLDKAEINAKGEAVLHLGSLEVHHLTPVVYQETNQCQLC
jgi:hypothetical protein